MMAEHKTHEKHEHVHGSSCGHKAIEHDGHMDYIHDGHLHHPHEGHVDEHVLSAGTTNPAACTPAHKCEAHEAAHAHGAKCGHDVVPHADHVDYVVGGHLHHAHEKHCDDHGRVQLSHN
jgi:hypothetical protein